MKNLVFLALLAAPFVYADTSIDAKVDAALAAESRAQPDRDRDRNRKAKETLQFFGLQDDMTVIELLPGAGWYTRVLGPVLRENGKLYVALGTGRVADSVLTEPGFENVGVLETTDNVHRPDGARLYVLDDFEFGIDNVDMILTFRNLHNFDAPSRREMNEEVFKSLREGGLYGVVDHTRRHMESDDFENRRRLDPVVAIKELLDVGFEFVNFSDLHFRADDELEYEVGRRSVSGNTDRFTMLFRKP